MSTDDKSGPPIRAELVAAAHRRHVNIQKWMEGQGAKIKAARPEPVYGACLFMAMQLCGDRDWQHLGPQQIELCEQRALSQGRMKMFGPKLPPTNEDWDDQIAQVRQAWSQPQQEAA